MLLCRARRWTQRFSGLRQLWRAATGAAGGRRRHPRRADRRRGGGGCQGTMRVRIGLEGRRAHTARPCTGRNAIHRLAPVLAAVAALREPATRARRVRVRRAAPGRRGRAGGWPATWCPTRPSVLINHRFAPDRTVEQAEASIREMLGRPSRTGGQVGAGRRRPPARRRRSTTRCWPRLVEATGSPPRAKLGWTDVASLVGARRSRGQLRARRPVAGPHAR